MRTAGSFWRACIFVLVSTMKVIKVFFLFILVGGDYGLELASPHKHTELMVGLTFCLHPFLRFSSLVHASLVGLCFLL